MKRILGAVLLAAVLLAAGCGSPEPEPQRRLAACAGPTDKLRAGDRVKIEFRRGETVVASASIQVGGVFSGEVPAGADIEVYADGRLVGSSGPGGAAYVRGAGCPESPAG